MNTSNTLIVNEITCVDISPPGRHWQYITHVGNCEEGWKFTVAQVVLKIGQGEIFTVPDQSRLLPENPYPVQVTVVSVDGRKYIRTVANKNTDDNLLNLPPCDC